jgi:uncharacterized protein YjbJ (UPF0337 family)
MKNATEIKGDWAELKDRLKQKFTALTDDDVRLEEGRQDDLYARLQKKLGKTKEEIHQLIAAL